MVFSSSHVWMWEMDCKESCTPKNWCFWGVALEKTLESPLDCKEIQPVHPKGNQSWRTHAEAETPTLWPPDAKKTDSFEKTLMLGKIEGKRRKGQQRMRWLDGITDWMDTSLSIFSTCIHMLKCHIWTYLNIFAQVIFLINYIIKVLLRYSWFTMLHL